MEFNPLVHVADDHGDGVRNEDGSFRLEPKWKELATDHLGRKFNANIHGEHKLTEQGFLKVRRRDAERLPMSATNRSQALVEKHREEGYAYYLIADDPGRQAQFENHDYEVVSDDDGPVTLSGGQGRTAVTTLKLMRKPQEWYDQDQQAKADLISRKFQEVSQPNEAEGQYAPEATSPLR